MPPRSKQPQEPDPNQGAFITAEIKGNGATDPKDFRLIGHIVDVNPEGVFPDQASLTTDGAMTPEAHLSAEALKARQTARRRVGQLGKHSPLTRDGTYMTVLPGDVLPPSRDFDREKPLIVTERNFEQAKRYAALLEGKRLERMRDNPTLDTIRISDVIQVLAEGFDLNNALDAARSTPMPADEPKNELPRFNTLSSRLKLVIEEADAARFVPASRSEINVVLPLIDHGIRAEAPSIRGATHNHLLETEIATKKGVRAKGYSQKVQAWYGDRAVASRCHEMVDYFEDADKSTMALHDLIDRLSELSSDQEKQAFIQGSYHPAMGVVLRHIVAYQLQNGDIAEEDLFFKPMSTSEDRLRTLLELPGPGKKIAGKVIGPAELNQARKLVEDQVKLQTGQYTEAGKTARNKTLVTPFTNPDMPKEVQTFIHQTFAAMELGDLRKLLPIVLASQERRKAFWRAALEDISGKYKVFVEPTLARTKALAS